jgi:indolepyruvate ferredoxin oxidoreductase alpha subunit
MKELLMGNEAVACGALAAGVQVVAGYPGTPSTEALETIAKRKPDGVYVEWSINEKAGAEVAAGAAYAGARSMVTMKQMGLNVASDPIMCVNYVGVKGGMVIYVADDPGPISSQTEQDTRSWGQFAKIPVLDCTSPEQAFEQVQYAFELSEAKGMPVILRSTTRVCHACAVVDVPAFVPPKPAEGFVKDKKWVIFPGLSYQNKKKIFARETALAKTFSENGKNTIVGTGKIGIACGGISAAYTADAIKGHEDQFTVFTVNTPYPFPIQAARQFADQVDSVLVFEELDPYIEDHLLAMGVDVIGKRSGAVPEAGELSAVTVADIIEKQTGVALDLHETALPEAPALPVRPPVLCAGCPHRGAFYAVKRAMRGRKIVALGDIGCYTLGNAMPLDMVDTCLCMGAGVTMAQGMNHVDPSTVNFAFVGDSTFFASGITGAINGVYNQADIVLAILDNSTTAMTGHQPHPGTGVTMMGERVAPVSIESVLRGAGVTSVRTVDPLNLDEAIPAIQAAADEKGVRAIIFKSPCIAIVPKQGIAEVDQDACIGCRRCINELGCPAITMMETENGQKAVIDPALCTGCGLCNQVCPKHCMEVKR